MSADDDLNALYSKQRSDIPLPRTVPADLHSQVQEAVRANLGSIGKTTDAVLVIFKAWLKEHEREAREPAYRHYEWMSGMVDER